MRIPRKMIPFGIGAVIATGVIAMQIPDGAIAGRDSSASAGPAPTSELGALALKVSLSARELYVIDNGEVVQTYAVTVGTSAHPTPKGGFGMKRIIWNPRWVPPDEKWAKGKTAKGPGEQGNPMGKVKVFFKEPDYYLHGTLNTSELGTAASHGCIRLRNADIIELATLLMERGGARVEPGFIRRMVNAARSTKEVRLTNALPLTIES